MNALIRHDHEYCGELLVDQGQRLSRFYLNGSKRGWSRGGIMAVFCLLLASCINPQLENWPLLLPDEKLFKQAYQADLTNQQQQSEAEYLTWILTFYQGSLVYQTGWLDIEAAVLGQSSRSVEHRDSLAPRLTELGGLIAAEWAKANQLRLIDSRMLSLWGSILQMVNGPDQQMLAVDLIEQDVHLLLAKQLSHEAILEQRYAANLEFDTFGDF